MYKSIRNFGLGLLVVILSVALLSATSPPAVAASHAKHFTLTKATVSHSNHIVIVKIELNTGHEISYIYQGLSVTHIALYQPPGNSYPRPVNDAKPDNTLVQLIIRPVLGLSNHQLLT